MGHRPKFSNRPITPANRTVGLDSAINRDCVLQIFQHSTPEQIESILRQAHFRPVNRNGNGRLAQHRSAIIDHEAETFLRSSEGMQQRAEKIKGRMKQSILDWFNSKAGQQAIEEAKARLLAIRLPTDPDVFTAACRRALAEEVAKWLRSPLGQAQLEQEKHRAIKQHDDGQDTTKAPAWHQRHIEGMKNA